MKKIINSPDAVVEEVLQDIEIVSPNILCGREGIVIAHKEKSDKVGFVSGGGNDHEPAHAGYVGYGMLDTAVGGNMFMSSSPSRVLHGIQFTNSGHGVLLAIKNYAGDITNFETAEELAGIEDIEINHVVARDGATVAEGDGSTSGCDTAGIAFVHKLAGVKTETGAFLAEVKRVAEETIRNIRSFGVSLSVCTIPAISACGFTIGEDCMEVGMGIRGETGTGKTKLKPSKEIADVMVNRVFTSKDYGYSEVAVMINSLGTTPLAELYILTSDVQTRLCIEGLRPVKYYVRNYMAAAEMAGASCSIPQLDEELERPLEYPDNTPTPKKIR